MSVSNRFTQGPDSTASMAAAAAAAATSPERSSPSVARVAKETLSQTSASTSLASASDVKEKGGFGRKFSSLRASVFSAFSKTTEASVHKAAHRAMASSTQVSNFYETRYQHLCSQGISTLSAEATVAIEMWLDPQTPPDIKNKIAPTPTSGGISGSYFVKDRNGNKIGVFKPMDEEAFMPHNPKGRAAQYNPREPVYLGPKMGHLQGVSWQKEIAAASLGHTSGVPFTDQLEVPFPQTPGSSEVQTKKGSIQQFMKGTPLEDLTFTQIKQIPTSEVHKIAVLDLMIGNGDRNRGNLLYDADAQLLTPIDHGLTFLDSLVTSNYSETDCIWHGFPQTEEPIAQPLKEYVSTLNGHEMATQLVSRGLISKESALEFEIRVAFLQEGVNKGLSLKEMATMCTREDETIPCFLDTVYRATQSAADPADHKEFVQTFSETLKTMMGRT